MLTTTAMLVVGLGLLLFFGVFALIGLVFKIIGAIVGGVFHLVFGLFGAVLGVIGTAFGLLVGGVATLFVAGILVLLFAAMALPLLIPLAVIAGVVWLVMRAAASRPPVVVPPAPPVLGPVSVA